MSNVHSRHPAVLQVGNKYLNFERTFFYIKKGSYCCARSHAGVPSFNPRDQSQGSILGSWEEREILMGKTLPVTEEQMPVTVDNTRIGGSSIQGDQMS